MSSKAVVPFSLETVQAIKAVAPTMADSRMFGVANVEQAIAVMVIADGLGIHPGLAFEYIYIIEQKPSLNPKGALALIHSSGELAEMQIDDQVDNQGNPVACTVRMKRRNGFEYTTTFSMADAERAGIAKPQSGWEKYPANMLRWRAVGYCADVVFPDVIGGLLRPEELGANVNADGAPIEGTWTIQEPRPQPKPAPPAVSVTPPSPEKPSEPAPQPTPAPSPAEEKPKPLDIYGLLALGFTAEQITVANEGRIPGTSEECQEVLARLEAQKAEAENADA